jgi:hypothetical protein
MPFSVASLMNDSVSESVTCWLYRKTLTLCRVNSDSLARGSAAGRRFIENEYRYGSHFH